MRLAFFIPGIATVAVVAVVSPPTARACFCKSIAGKVDAVVWEPSRESPDRVRIEGAFAFRDYDTMPWSWHPPLRGYLYFRCDDGRDPECLADWEAIEAHIDTHEGCAAFADFDVVETARIRSFAEEPTEPDVYLPGFGVGDYDGSGITCDEVAVAEAETRPEAHGDAGTTRPDAGVAPVPADPAPDATGGGCAAAAPAQSASHAVAPFAALLLVVTRRRRSPG